MIDAAEIASNLPHPESTIYTSPIPLNCESSLRAIDLVLTAASDEGDVSYMPFGVTDVHAMQRVEIADDLSLSLVGAYVSCLAAGKPPEQGGAAGFENARGTLVRGALGWRTGEDDGLALPREQVVYEKLVERSIWRRAFNPNALAVILARWDAGHAVQNALTVLKEHSEARFIETQPGLF